MKKKYKLTLSFLGILLLFASCFGIGYGVWINTRSDFDLEVKHLDCFKIYLESYDIKINNIEILTSEEGKQNSPYSLTITNICDVDKELQIRLNVLKDNTVDTKSLTVDSTGNLEIDETLYKDLTTTITNSDDVVESKLIGSIQVGAGETARTNIKLWFDEKRNPSIKKDDVFRGRFELLDGDANLSLTLSDKLLSSYKKGDDVKFTQVALNNENLIAIEDKVGKNYYYRGNVTNNYVSFANKIWRIVSLNSDGSIKLILNESIGLSKYGDNTNYKDYVGFIYDHSGRIVDNKITKYLDNWYLENITNIGLDSKVVSRINCNDTSFTIDDYIVYYGGYTRLFVSNTPTVTCPERTSDFGGPLDRKIGLITGDEVVIAGGMYNTPNNSYYLYNGEKYYTMTPSSYSYNKPEVMVVTETGSLDVALTNSDLSIRPVINLIPKIKATGSGSDINPYVIDVS